MATRSYEPLWFGAKYLRKGDLILDQVNEEAIDVHVLDAFGVEQKLQGLEGKPLEKVAERRPELPAHLKHERPLALEHQRDGGLDKGGLAGADCNSASSDNMTAHNFNSPQTGIGCDCPGFSFIVS